MALWRPSRRELITAGPLLLGAELRSPLLAAEPRPLRFFVIGDWGRRGAEFQVPVAKRMGEVAAGMGGIDFVVTTGDNFYIFGVASASDPHWEHSFENIYTHRGLRGVPWYPTLGNHDYYGSAEAQIDRYLRNPRGRWRMPGYWHALRGADQGSPQVDLFFIDTVTWRGETWLESLVGSKPPHERRKMQIRWLEEKLSASTAPFKLVFGHHGIYSIGRQGGEMDMPELDDLLRRHEVTAYVNGHDHCMYHVTHRATHYLCSGAGSEVLAKYTGGNEPGCVLRNYCEKADDGSPLFPVWQSFLAKSADEQYRLDGGFASFEVGSTSIDIKFHDSRSNVKPKHAFTIMAPVLMRSGNRSPRQIG